MPKIVRMSELHSPWLRDSAWYERRYAAGVAAGLGGWFSALCAAYWTCGEGAERDRINALMCAEWEAMGADDTGGDRLVALLDDIAAHERAEQPSEYTVWIARFFGGLVARESVGEDTSAERARVAGLVRAELRRRWLSEAHALRARRLERQRRREAASRTACVVTAEVAR
jgi:hypothetical protein